MVQNEPMDVLTTSGRPSRRHILAAFSAAAMLLPGTSEAVMELWEEGDPLCKVVYKPLDKPDGYELDAAYLESFITVSEALTGVSTLDRYLASEYMERYATHRQLSRNLDILIKAWRGLGDGTPSEDEVRAKIIGSPDPELRASAKQLMYLWYISAFYIPLDVTPEAKPPLRDDGSDTRKKVWVYGTPEQYERGLVWQVIHAHAPMMPGGKRQHWAKKPEGLTVKS
jgi:hypothetical protein